MKSLWDKGFKPNHLKGGFRECGLFPFNPHAIPAYKTAPALPFTQGSEESSTPSTSETPLCTELRHYFVKHLRTKEAAVKMKRKRIAIHATGDALTNDDVLEYLKANTKAKKLSPKKTSQTKSSKNNVHKNKRMSAEDVEDNDYSEDKDSSHCFSCGKEYIDGQENLWVGCDNYYRWYHFKCAGFKQCQTREDDFICSICNL